MFVPVHLGRDEYAFVHVIVPPQQRTAEADYCLDAIPAQIQM